MGDDYRIRGSDFVCRALLLRRLGLFACPSTAASLQEALEVEDLLKRILDQAGDPTNPGRAHIDDEPSTASVPFWVPC
jgi:hypothetical protein